MGKNDKIQKTATGNTDLLDTDEIKTSTELAHIPGIRRAAQARIMSEAQRKTRGMKLEHFFQMTDGDQVEGIFLGRGGDTLVNSRDPKLPAKQSLPTFRIQVSETVIVRLLGSANLVGQLDGLPIGTHVVVTRLGQTEGRGDNRVTAFGVETGAIYAPEGWTPDKLPSWAPANGTA